MAFASPLCGIDTLYRLRARWHIGMLGSLLFVLLVTGCSSGGGDGGNDMPPAKPPVTPPPPPPVSITTAEGLWTGTTSDGRTISGVVLNDETYWLWYSAVGQPSVLAGGFQGSGLSQNGAFTSSNGTDFNLETFGQLDVSLAASYVIRQSFNGVITYPTTTQTSFTSTFKPDYDVAPSIASLVGTYIWSTTSGPFTISIDASGSITGAASACSYTGALSPRPSGNVYDVSITRFGRICASSIVPMVGVAWFDAATNRIYIMTIDSVNRPFSLLFIGSKQ